MGKGREADIFGGLGSLCVDLFNQIIQDLHINVKKIILKTKFYVFGKRCVCVCVGWGGGGCKGKS